MPLPSFAREPILNDLGEALDWFLDHPEEAKSADQQFRLEFPDGRILLVVVATGKVAEAIVATVDEMTAPRKLKEGKPLRILRPT